MERHEAKGGGGGGVECHEAEGGRYYMLLFSDIHRRLLLCNRLALDANQKRAA